MPRPKLDSDEGDWIHVTREFREGKHHPAVTCKHCGHGWASNEKDRVRRHLKTCTNLPDHLLPQYQPRKLGLPEPPSPRQAKRKRREESHQDTNPIDPIDDLWPWGGPNQTAVPHSHSHSQTTRPPPASNTVTYAIPSPPRAYNDHTSLASAIINDESARRPYAPEPPTPQPPPQPSSKRPRLDPGDGDSPTLLFSPDIRALATRTPVPRHAAEALVAAHLSLPGTGELRPVRRALMQVSAMAGPRAGSGAQIRHVERAMGVVRGVWLERLAEGLGEMVVSEEDAVRVLGGVLGVLGERRGRGVVGRVLGRTAERVGVDGDGGGKNAEGEEDDSKG